MNSGHSGSQQSLIFRDRKSAGLFLAEHMTQYRDRAALVLGIPRGGIPVAAEVAKTLNGEIDLIVARKLGAPSNEELAFGAVTANGGKFIDWELVAALEITQEQVGEIISATMEKARNRECQLRGGRALISPHDRLVILVDDGLATGATMRAAARSVRQSSPAKLVIAVPVGSPHACAALCHEADEIICPFQPRFFYAVGSFYEHFEPVEDDEVIRILQECRRGYAE